jgi:hypothetical protein
MGRPLSKQQFFGANEKHNIKVQFFNGTASVPGFIVKQTGSKRFVCQDADGIRRTCYLVDKASADLAFREMTITLKYDEGTVVHATKIARHRFSSVDGKTFSAPWNFSTSTTDSVWQIEEAGTDDQLTDATDLEGDDVSTLQSYPVPGSGVFLIPSLAGLPGYSAVGSPAEPTGSIADNLALAFGHGLRRNKYLGNFSATASTAVASWVYTWFNDHGADVVAGSEVFDTFAGFGSQSDLDVVGGHNFSLESKGWIQPPVSQNYNFYGTVDDQMALWIGNEAKTGYDNTNATCIGKGGGVAPAKTVYLDSTKWYPVRLWMGEFNGGCQEQIFAVGENNTKYGGPDFLFKYNTQGESW